MARPRAAILVWESTPPPLPPGLAAEPFAFAGRVGTLLTTPGPGVTINRDFAAAPPDHERGMGAAPRPACGLALATRPDRAVEALR